MPPNLGAFFFPISIGNLRQGMTNEKEITHERRSAPCLAHAAHALPMRQSRDPRYKRSAVLRNVFSNRNGNLGIDDVETNVEPFTPEVLARRLIEQYGDAAALQAALNADHFFMRNDDHVAKIWYEASRIITAVQLIGRATGQHDNFGSGS
jgi:hypothetical protein